MIDRCITFHVGAEGRQIAALLSKVDCRSGVGNLDSRSETRWQFLVLSLHSCKRRLPSSLQVSVLQAALDCRLPFFRHYRDSVEPYMQHSDFYPKLQILTFLFYFTVAYCLSVFALVKPGCRWMLDLALIHAGAAAQAQVSHIGASLHWKTRPMPPAENLPIFWAVNLLLLVLPHLLALRVLLWPRFFLCGQPAEKAKAGE